MEGKKTAKAGPSMCLPLIDECAELHKKKGIQAHPR